MSYRLSQFIPLRFTSVYRTNGANQRSVWWQWRGCIWAHRITVL